MKLTDPPTAVLYITPDWQHLQELKDTIHVKEVNLGQSDAAVPAADPGGGVSCRAEASGGVW